MASNQANVTSVDALFELRLLAGLVSQANCSADANRDGVVNIRDPLIIRQRVAGIVVP